MKPRIRPAYGLGAALLLVLGSITLGASVMTVRSATLADEAAARRDQSYRLADEWRRSSDDLTRLARTFVATGDSRWERQYQEVLDIRDGRQPRPHGYERVYWDFRAADDDTARPLGEAVSLLDLMKRAGFSEAELAKLEQALANAGDLVRTEAVAMNLVKGLHDDGLGGFTRQAEPDVARAVALMNDAEYHRNKVRVLAPVNELLVLLDERTASEFAAAAASRRAWSRVTMAATACLVVLLLGGLFYLWRDTRIVLGNVSRVASGIAAGRLDLAIDIHLPGQGGNVLRSLADMQRRLSALVDAIRSGADEVATASAQIAHGNQDLSRRTEQQARALQQTASTMEQLGTTSRNNADGAQQASQLAKGASTIAAQGGAVVEQVVHTMQGISDSSRRIGDIIGVIDGIAFQTNILALNAAAEAARAGEQGRGFAVVASEVRSLAQRSAEAAKEIKTLIGRSVEQVKQGTVLVDQAGQTMGEIVGAIHRVNDLVAEITAASVEQSAGVRQVGDVVGQMDQTTQQNAALVEQSTSAAESLRNQAGQLVRAVAVFTLAQDERVAREPVAV
jgi:methyl-accepting chemotaxis protein